MTDEPGPGEPWTVLRLVRWSADYLEGKGIERGQARLDAEHLLADALDTTRLQLYLQFDRPLTPDELAAFKPGLLRRAGREPLQYVMGRAAFRELDLAVDTRVLIPRPETEELVEAVLEWARERTGADRRPARGAARGAVRLPWSKDGAASADAEDRVDGVSGEAEESPDPNPAVATVGVRERPGARRHTAERTLRALDLGTGSGCIALSLALEGPFRTVVATDASAGALEVARGNARDAGLDDRVRFREGDLWDALGGTSERFDVVVSNPPYVADEDELAPEIREHEPRSALFAGPEGTELLGRLVKGAPPALKEGGLLALEVGAGQTATAAGLVRSTGAFEEPRIRRDLAGRPRFVLAVRAAATDA